MQQVVTAGEATKEIDRLLKLYQEREKIDQELNILRNPDLLPEKTKRSLRIFDILLGIIVVLLVYWLGYFVFLIGAGAIFLILETTGIFELDSISQLKFLARFLTWVAVIISIVYMINGEKKDRVKDRIYQKERKAQLERIKINQSETERKVRSLEIKRRQLDSQIRSDIIPHAYIYPNDLVQLNSIISYYGQADTLKEAIHVLQENKKHKERMNAQQAVSEELAQFRAEQQAMAHQLSAQVSKQVGQVQSEVDKLNKKIY